jgi:hypothetical protein
VSFPRRQMHRGPVVLFPRIQVRAVVNQRSRDRTAPPCATPST